MNIAVGERVKLTVGMFTGETGLVLRFDNSLKRYIVQLGDGQTLALSNDEFQQYHPPMFRVLGSDMKFNTIEAAEKWTEIISNDSNFQKEFVIVQVVAKVVHELTTTYNIRKERYV